MKLLINLPVGYEPDIKRQPNGDRQIEFVRSAPKSAAAAPAEPKIFRQPAQETKRLFDTFDPNTAIYSPREIGDDPAAIQRVDYQGETYQRFQLLGRKPYAFINKWRCEYSQQKNRPKVGDQIELVGSFVVPEDCKWGSGGLNSVMIGQLHCGAVIWEKNGKKKYVSPCFSLWIGKDGMVGVTTRWGEINDSSKGVPKGHKKQEKGIWEPGEVVPWGAQIKIDPFKGWIKVWIGDQLFYERTGGVGIARTSESYFKWGLYRPFPEKQLAEMVRKYNQQKAHICVLHGRTLMYRR